MKLSKRVWDNIRARYESGETVSSIAKHYQISRSGIQARARKGGWTQDVSEIIRKKSAEVAAKISPLGTTQEKAKAIAEEAGKIAAVRLRHRKEWEQVVAIRQEALSLRKPVSKNPTRDDVNSAQRDSFQAMKLAKITAEVTTIQQIGERRCWGIESEPVQAQNVKGFRVVME